MSITIYSGGSLTVYAGAIMDVYGSVVVGGTVMFSEFNPSGLIPGNNIEDSSGSFSGIGFTINNANATGVSMTNLSSENQAFFSGNAYSNGYIWTANWAAGSTYASTPVAMYTGFSGPGSIVFWIIDPADPSYSSGVTGTFNYPVTFVPTSNSTNFQQ